MNTAPQACLLYNVNPELTRERENQLKINSNNNSKPACSWPAEGKDYGDLIPALRHIERMQAWLLTLRWEELRVW